MDEMKPGGGKYDDLCTLVREQAKADGVVLIVFNGTKGNGLSVAATIDVLRILPDDLRRLADGMEQTYNSHPGGFLGYLIDKCLAVPPDGETKQ